MKKLFSIFLSIFLLLSIGGCADKNAGKGAGKKLSVLASVYPVYEFAKTVAGDRAEVKLLLPPSAEAHDWEPSAADIKNIETSKMLLYNGGGIEPWAERLVENFKEITFVKTGDGLFVQWEGRKAPDPHVWLDPILAQHQVAKIMEAFVKADPDGKAVYEKNAQAYVNELRQLDNEYKRLAEKSKGKAFIPMHAAFGYLAKRYGWEQVALLGMSPHAEPTPLQMANIIKTIKEKGVKHIFVEPHVSSKVMQELARETSTQLLYLDTLEEPSKKTGDDYLKRMRANLGNLFKSFGVEQ